MDNFLIPDDVKQVCIYEDQFNGQSILPWLKAGTYLRKDDLPKLYEAWAESLVEGVTELALAAERHRSLMPPDAPWLRRQAETRARKLLRLEELDSDSPFPVPDMTTEYPGTR